MPARVRGAVTGAGPAGIGAGIRLRQAGLTDFVILERADAVGGTWPDHLAALDRLGAAALVTRPAAQQRWCEDVVAAGTG